MIPETYLIFHLPEVCHFQFARGGGREMLYYSTSHVHMYLSDTGVETKQADNVCVVRMFEYKSLNNDKYIKRQLHIFWYCYEHCTKLLISIINNSIDEMHFGAQRPKMGSLNNDKYIKRQLWLQIDCRL